MQVRRLGLWILAVLALPAYGSLYRFDTGIVPAAAGKGGPDGVIHYRIRSSAAPKVRPLQKCVLLHGHGFNQRNVDRIAGIAPTFPRLRGLLPFEMADAVAYGYYGRSFLRRLENACEDVYVLFRETNLTSIWETTLQTEEFLGFVCKPDPKRPLKSGQRGCAILAHSKSAPAALSVARRCMDKTSKLGAATCGYLAEVYSMAGINLGAGAATLLLGSKVTADAAAALKIESVLAAAVSVMVGQSKSLGLDLTGDPGPGKNPGWLDLGPLSPMDDGKTTLYDAHSGLVLTPKGWWRGDYAASAGGHLYRGLKPEEVGYGTLVDPFEIDNPAAGLYATLFPAFAKAIAPLHLNEFEGVYQDGLMEMERLSPSFRQSGHPEFSWSTFQESDGIVERETALRPCMNGLAVAGSSVTSCTFIPEINHFTAAGPADEVADDILQQLVKDGR